MKVTLIRKEGIKLSLLTDDMIVFVQNPKESAKNKQTNPLFAVWFSMLLLPGSPARWERSGVRGPPPGHPTPGNGQHQSRSVQRDTCVQAGIRVCFGGRPSAEVPQSGGGKRHRFLGRGVLPSQVGVPAPPDPASLLCL